MSLAACTQCRRHVRVDEAACPFCGGVVGAPKLKRGGRMHRGALMFAVTVVGCSSNAFEDTNAVPAYGVPYDAAMDDTTTPDTAPTDSAVADVTDAATDSTKDSRVTEVAIDASDAADTEETRIFPPYGAPSTPVLA